MKSNICRRFFRGILACCLAAGLCLSALPAAAVPALQPNEVLPEKNAAPHAAQDTVAVDEANFPDPAFRAYVESTFDRNGDQQLSAAECRAAERISCPAQGIRSLAGIRFFPNLNYLYCDRNSITAIDLSHNPLVTYLSFEQNPVSELNIAACTKLYSLDMMATDVAQADLTPFAELSELTAGLQPLTELDLSRNTALAHLIIADADLRTLHLQPGQQFETFIVSGTWMARLDLGPQPQLPMLCVPDNYLLTLDLREAPDCSVVQAPGNRLISVHGRPGMEYLADLSRQGTYEAAVSESGGFDFATIDPDFALGTITQLSQGQFSGSVLSGVRAGDTVTYTYTHNGLSVDATVHFNAGNYWVSGPAIHGWSAGAAPSQPEAVARYGTPVFSYGRPGGTSFSTVPPTEAGTWVLRAEVPGTAGYGPLQSEITFEITPATVPSVAPRFAVYRRSLGSVELPEGFRWQTPGVLVGDVGIHTFNALWEPDDGSAPVSVPVTVVVTPKQGSLCRISPIENEQQSRNIQITDGTFRLTEGKDYNISRSVEGSTVTIVITFTGNYYGTAVRSFTFASENAWTVPLSIKSWPEGTPPNAPVAQSLYGTPVFSYLVNNTWQNNPPTQAGQYVVRAVVPATDQYPELSAETAFRVLSGPPAVDALEATYGDLLADVDLPAGYSWDDPMQSVGNAGERTFDALYTPQSDAETGGPVRLQVTVHPKDGLLCTISPITNEYESRNIVITDGNVTLLKGRDYFVASDVTGATATVIISFVGNYTGTVTRTFTFRGVNVWLVPLTLESWIEGTAPNTPTADARYGEPVFSYLVDGSWQSDPPTTAGSYTVRAEVAASEYYDALSAELAFSVYAAAEVPDNLTAVYGSALAAVQLPEEYTWTAPETPVGNVGIRTHPAVWSPGDGREPQTVGLHVSVTPKDGTLCSISPVTNSQEAQHIVIRDGSETLISGKDYVVSSSVSGNAVTVTITFTGNYTGVVERAFTFSVENVWTEPLSIQNWYEGGTPQAPRAAARYGSPVFSYAAAASPLDETAALPTRAGTYIVYAEVAQTPYYNGLSAQATFEILPRPSQPAPAPVHAVYGDLTAALPLPDGYQWAADVPQYVGSVGEHTYQAVCTTGTAAETVPVSVIVSPRDGSLCTVSPVTNAYEAAHIVITDGGVTLVKGRDYNLSTQMNGNTVTVTITFTGNYAGSVRESYTIEGENAWVVPLSVRNWVEGSSPSTPVAQAKYGTPVFSYQVNGTWQSEPPEAPGQYVLRAVVPASPFYAEISDEITFRILRGVPSINALTAVYGDILSSVALPAGYTWDDPSQPVGSAGVHSFGAFYASEDPDQTGGPVQLEVNVVPKDGLLCSISPVTNGYDSRHIVIRDGNTVLVSGTDYTVSTAVEENVVNVTITFMGNYQGSTVRSFTFGTENSWIVPLSIENWFAGSEPKAPVADAAYGEPVFSYFVGGVWQDAPPAQPGSYEVRAEVAASAYYPALSMQVPFQVYPAPSEDLPQNLTAVYGDQLKSVALPDGFTWTDPEAAVGNAGVRVHTASYASAGGSTETVGLQITVAPKDGALCTVSPVTDSYEARHIVIRDGINLLTEGTDYVLTADIDANRVIITVNFIGNYCGTVERSYSFTLENVWTEPLTMEGWTAGENPHLPVAHARYGTAVFSFAAAADPLDVSRTVPTAPGDYIVYADVPSTIYYNGLSAHAAFRIAPASASGQPELAASPQYSVTLEAEAGLGKVLTGEALLISRSGHTVQQVLPMAVVLPDAAGTALDITGPGSVPLQLVDVVGTGSIMQLASSDDPAEIYDSATIAVLGDVLGTGQLSIAQIVAMAGNIMGTRPLSEIAVLAGDFNGTGAIDIADLVKAARMLQAASA